MSKSFIVMAGLPGTGKSTVSKKLEEILDYDLYSLLQLRREFGHKRYRPKQNHYVLTEMYRRAEESLDNNRGVILDSTYSTRNGRRFAYEIAWSHHVPLIVLECYCSEKASKQRMKQRPKNDGLVVEPKNPKAYDGLVQRKEAIIGDFNFFPSTDLNYLRFNSETNLVELENVNPNAREITEKIIQTISDNSQTPYKR